MGQTILGEESSLVMHSALAQVDVFVRSLLVIQRI